MQGQHPTGYAHTPTQRATSDTTRNVNRDWTCQRWFNNIADKVSTKTHPYFGKFVAVATLPFTFIPSLACDLFNGAKSLYQRTIRTAPVLNHFSTGGTSSSTSESNTSPTIHQLRQKFPELDDYITHRDAADRRAAEEASGLHSLCENLRQDKATADEANNNKINQMNQLIDELRYIKQCNEDIKIGQRDKINKLQRRISELEIENNQLRSCLCQFQDTNPSPGLDRKEEDSLTTSTEPLTSTAIDQLPRPIIVVDEVDDSTAEKSDYIDPESTKEPTDNEGTESSATDAKRNDETSETSSDEGFETIPMPLSTPESHPNKAAARIGETLNS